MPNQPFAYFITFRTYGTWLHGDERGSVDRIHNRYDTPCLAPNPNRKLAHEMSMTHPSYDLGESERPIVRDALVKECHFRGWILHALHVRTNHVHMVVSADRDPKQVMQMCKINASKCLNRAGRGCSDQKHWASHGSTKYIWDEVILSKAIEYTLMLQGEVTMAIYALLSESESK